MLNLSLSFQAADTSESLDMDYPKLSTWFFFAFLVLQKEKKKKAALQIRLGGFFHWSFSKLLPSSVNKFKAPVVFSGAKDSRGVVQSQGVVAFVDGTTQILQVL